MTWKEIIEKFKIFMNSIKRKYNIVGYIRAIEIQKRSKRFHVHLILVFGDVVPRITREDIQRLWKYGNIDIGRNVYDVYGLIEYLTLNKSLMRQEDDNSLSYYPKGAKIIATSLKEKAEYREIIISDEEIENVLQFCRDNDKHIRYESHEYFDGESQRRKLDGIFIMPGEDYIVNNFGTKEDDMIMIEGFNIGGDIEEDEE